VEDVLSCSVEECFKKCLDPKPDADEFQNLIGTSLSKDMSLIKFSRKSVSICVKLLKQTNRQIWVKNSLLRGDNNAVQVCWRTTVQHLQWTKFHASPHKDATEM